MVYASDPPVAADDRVTTTEDDSVRISVLANDTDVDGDTLTVVEATVPAAQGTLVDNGDGTVTDPNTGLMWQQEGPDLVMT